VVELPSLLPALDIDGFSLRQHRSLQFSVFTGITMDLIWKAEKALTGIAAAERNNAPTSSTGHMDLLRTMLQQEAANDCASNKAGNSHPPMAVGRIGMASLKPIVKKIRSTSRGHIYLLLEEAGANTGDPTSMFPSNMAFM
jgi:hypothetical protein